MEGDFNILSPRAEALRKAKRAYYKAMRSKDPLVREQAEAQWKDALAVAKKEDDIMREGDDPKGRK